MSQEKTILFLSEMPVTNGVIQAQMLPVVLAAAKDGYRVKILETIGRFDSQEKYRPGIEEKLRQHKVEIQSVAVPRHTFWPSIIYFTLEFLRLIKKIIKENNDCPVVIYARNYKFAILLLWLKRCHGISFVYSPRGAYVAERKFYRRLKDLLYASWIKFFEKKAILKSSATILETEGFKNHLMESYKIKDDNLKVLPNFFDASMLPPAGWNREEMRQKLGFDGKKVIVYAGTAEVWYDFQKMFDLVSRLKKKDPQIFFQLFLKEDYARDESRDILENLEKSALEFGLEKGRDFRISSYPPEERYFYLSACDAGICLTTPSKFKTMMMYLKIVDYLGAGLLIIVNNNVTEAVRIIAKADAGYAVNYNKWDRSVSEIEISRLFNREITKKDRLAPYSSESVLPAYLKLFSSVFNSGK